MDQMDDQKAAVWASLPSDPLQLIADRLLADVADYVRFRVVCTSWRSATVELRYCNIPPQLLLRHDKSANIISYLSPSDGRNHPIPLPDIGGGEFMLSSNGWLIFCDASYALCFVNPLTSARVCLPALWEISPFAGKIRRYLHTNTIPKRWLGEVALSASPTSPGGCTVMLSEPHALGLVALPAGQQRWVILDMETCYHSIIFHKGSFFAADCSPKVISFNIDLEKVVLIDFSIQFSLMSRWRLVDSFGELLLVQRFFKPTIFGPKHSYSKEVFTGPTTFHYKLIFERTPKQIFETTPKLIFETESIDIYRLNLNGNPPFVVELKSLGENMLFLGTGNSATLQAKRFHSCEENCIYLSLDHCFCVSFERNVASAFMRTDSGVFNVKDHSMGELPSSFGGRIDPCDDSIIGMWHMPSLC